MKTTYLRTVLWIWVIAAVVAYLAQFRGYAGPILRKLGLQ